MKRIFSSAAMVAAVAMGAASASHAALVSVAGGLSSAGGAPAIIAAPASSFPGGSVNNAIQGFDEQQGYTLAAALAVDGGSIAAGTVVNSHMIFLDPEGISVGHGAGGNGSAVTFTFDGAVLGVMSDRHGTLEAASQFLGAAGTAYPGGPLGSRGMEMNPNARDPDWYSVAGNTITLGMGGRIPGDWIRVVTISEVPVPASFLLMGSALAGLGALSRRRRKTA